MQSLVMAGIMTNPKLGQFEIEGLISMSEDSGAFAEYLQTARISYRHHEGPMPADVLQSLLILLKYVAADEEASLKEMQAKGEDTTGHIAYDIRRLAWHATVSSFPIQSWLSWKKHGVPHHINRHGDWEPML